MDEEEKDNNINEEIKDSENEGDLGPESDRVEEDILGSVDNSVEDNDLADDDGSDPEDIAENKDEDVVSNEEFAGEASDTNTGDDTSGDSIKETTEEDILASSTNDISVEATPDEAENEENIDEVLDDVQDDVFDESDTFEGDEVADSTNDDSITDVLTDNDSATDDIELKDKPKLALRFSTLISTLKGIKDKVFAIKGRDLIKVFSNPWVIANGVVLVVALSMTVVIVSWFKARTAKINDALTNLAQLQSETAINRVSEEPVRVTVQPFIVDQEVLTEDGLRTVDNKKEHGNGEFSLLLESAEQSFNKKEYQKALPFYKALISNGSELKDKGFLDLRISECYFYSGLYNEAIETLRAGLDVKVSNRDNWFRINYLLAECYIKLSNYDKGRRTLYALMALEGEFTPGLKGMTERAYFTIADSYLEEARLGFKIDD